MAEQNKHVFLWTRIKSPGLAWPTDSAYTAVSSWSFLPGLQLGNLSGSWSQAFHVTLSPCQRKEPPLRPFWLSELKKFICMIRHQLCCSHVAWSLQVQFLFSKWAPQMWTVNNSTSVKRRRHYANAVIISHFEISKDGLSSRMKPMDRFPFWEDRCIFSHSLCLAQAYLPHPRIWNAASCCPQLVLFDAYITMSENLIIWHFNFCKHFHIFVLDSHYNIVI